MKKAQKHRSFTEKLSKPQRTALHITAAILVVMLASYCFRGWLRVTVIPGVATALYGQTLQRDMDAELSTLQDPLHLLGYDQADISKAKCTMVAARGFSVELNCSSTLHAYSETPKDEAGKQALNQKAFKLQTLLQQRSWEGEYTDTAQTASLNLLVSNINKGIDYTPDAAYTKPVKDHFCIIDTNTAFSSPKPAAMSTQISCSHVMQIFGPVRHEKVYFQD